MHIQGTRLGFVTWITSRLRLLAIVGVLSIGLMPVLIAVSTSVPLGLQSTVSAGAAAQCQNGTPDPQNPNPPCLGPLNSTSASNCPQGTCVFETYINPAIRLVASLVGIGVAIAIMWSGIDYARSANNAQLVSAAKTRMVKAVFVLIGYVFLLAFLNWFIPGGI